MFPKVILTKFEQLENISDVSSTVEKSKFDKSIDSNLVQHENI